MHESTPKEKMLKKIRKALIEKKDNPYPKLESEVAVFTASEELPELHFAEQFTRAGGQFIFCENEVDFAEQIIGLAEQEKWKKISCCEPQLQQLLEKYAYPFDGSGTGLEQTDAAITLCEALIAATGSILISNTNRAGRSLTIYPTVHIVLAYTSQLIVTLKEALAAVQRKYDPAPSLISVITGPSSTADIANVMVKGAHGPKEIYLFLLDDQV